MNGPVRSIRPTPLPTAWVLPLFVLSGCATLSVPSPSSLDARIPAPPGVVAAEEPLELPAPQFLPGSTYATVLEGEVRRLEPTEASWHVEATARSEIVAAQDGSLTWKVQQIDGKALLDGKPTELTVEQKRMLLEDYRLDREALAIPKRPLQPGEGWSRKVPVLRVSGDGMRTVGQEEETVTFLGTRPTDEGTQAVFDVEVLSETATEAPDGTEVMRVSSHVARQLEVNVVTGAVVLDTIRRHEVAASRGGRTETTGQVKHRRGL